MVVTVWELESQANSNNHFHIIRSKFKHGTQCFDGQLKVISELGYYKLVASTNQKCELGNQTYMKICTTYGSIYLGLRDVTDKMIEFLSKSGVRVIQNYYIL